MVVKYTKDGIPYGSPPYTIATLTPGQSVAHSTPRKLGEPAVELHFQHLGDDLFVDAAALE
jgi:hypothetical protein